MGMKYVGHSKGVNMWGTLMWGMCEAHQGENM